MCMYHFHLMRTKGEGIEEQVNLKLKRCGSLGDKEVEEEPLHATGGDLRAPQSSSHMLAIFKVSSFGSSFI